MAAINLTERFGYDQLNRLTTRTLGAAAPTAVATYAPNGNILTKLDVAGATSGTYSYLARTTSGSGLQLKLPTSTSSFDSRDRLSGDTYDANGNTLTGLLSPTAPGLPPETSGTDDYDFENRLIVRHRADGSSVNLAYDADGNRTGKTIIDSLGSILRWTTWLVDTNNLTGYAQVVEERTVAYGPSPIADRLQVYTYGSDLISQTVHSSSTSTSDLNYFSYDGHGSVRELTDASGAITDRYDYDAFGNLIRFEQRNAATGQFESLSPLDPRLSSRNTYLYCGEQWDPDLGLYFLRARFMNPDSGRFWNMDTYEGSASDPVTLHKYLYASSNPVMFVDPSGQITLYELGVTALIGATVSVAFTIPTINWGEESVADIGKKLGIAAVEGAALSLIGGIAGKTALKLLPNVKWLLARGAIGGGAGGAAAQLAKEVIEVVFLGQPLKIWDRTGRVFIATAVGIGIGGATFRIEPLVEKIFHPTFKNSQGFRWTIPWIEITRERLSATGVAGALSAEGLSGIISDWLQDVFDFEPDEEPTP